MTHSKNHWFTKQTMIEYTDTIIVLYVSANRESDDQLTLVIMDNFNSQIKPSVTNLLEDNNSARIEFLFLSVFQYYINALVSTWSYIKVEVLHII